MNSTIDFTHTMKVRFSIITLGLATLLSILSIGESYAQVRPQGNLNFMIGIPQGEFDDRVGGAGFGGNLFAGIGISGTPIVLGIDLGYLMYGYERRNEPFSTTIPDVTVDVVTSNNIMMGHFVMRLQVPEGAFQPYVDGLFGGKYLFTETSIENERWIDRDESVAVSTNFDDWAWSYGVGGGLNLRLYSGPIGKDINHGSVKLHFGLRYLVGSEAEYLKKGSIRRVNGNVSYDVERSRTDLLIPQIGATINF